MSSSTKIVIPPIEERPDELGIITSAYGPEEAGDLRDIVGKPPETDEVEEE